jgi:hypothetical protein
MPQSGVAMHHRPAVRLSDNVSEAHMEAREGRAGALIGSHLSCMSDVLVIFALVQGQLEQLASRPPHFILSNTGGGRLYNK